MSANSTPPPAPQVAYNQPRPGAGMASAAGDGGQWFRDAWGGYAVSLKIDEVLFEGKSDFQDILVFKSKDWGHVLVLGGIIQCTERDEFTYQEMITHLPLNSHPNPKKVLVIGGGDGGVVREVLKHKSVDKVVLCEIDQKVIDVCKQYLPSMASCLDNEKVVVHVGDGIAYVKDFPGEFDVIITDAPDPIGAAEGLFQKAFYKDMKKALKPNGVMCCQGETPWFDLPLIKRMIGDCRSIFPRVAYATGNTPTYAGGSMGYMLCSADPAAELGKPLKIYTEEELREMKLQYYTAQIHQAAFTLPNYIRTTLQEVLDT